MLNAQTVENFTAFYIAKNAQTGNCILYVNHLKECLMILENGQQSLISLWDKEDIENADRYTEEELSERYETRRNFAEYIDREFVTPFKNMLCV